jgi:hypothetical protein
MTKTIFIVGLLFLLVSCNQQDPCSSSTEKQKQDGPTTASAECTTPETPTEPAEPTDPSEEPGPDVPAEALQFDSNLSLNEFDDKDEEKVYKAIEIIKEVIRTDEFRQRVLNFTYQGKKTFVDNDGLTNAQIYQKLLDGSETLKPEVDHEMDLELELYYSSRSTVGYTYANVLRIWMNTKYFDPYTPAEVAGNVFHEWTHKLGFDHASSYSVSRDSSVPYALGYLMEELGKKYE